MLHKQEKLEKLKWLRPHPHLSPAFVLNEGTPKIYKRGLRINPRVSLGPAPLVWSSCLRTVISSCRLWAGRVPSGRVW